MNNQVFKSDVIDFLNSLPAKVLVPLKEDNTIALYPSQILEFIDSKAPLGKKYYLQIAKHISEAKKNGIFRKKQDQIVIM